MSKSNSFDVIIIGAGPGGYVCALRCAQLGLKVAIIDKNEQMGGTCLNVGCIPSKALLHSSELFHQLQHGESHGISADNIRIDIGKFMHRKQAVVDQLRKGIRTLLDKRGVAVFHGQGKLAGDGSVEVNSGGKSDLLKAKDIVIATGSVVSPLRSVETDGKTVVTSTEALSFDQVPKRLVVIGGGAIGLEMGSVWSRLGSEVTIVEFLPTIAAGADNDVSKLAERIFKKQGMRIETGTKVTGCSVKRGKATIKAEKGGSELAFEADKVLVAVGRKPFTDGLNLEQVGIKLDDKGRIPVQHFKTIVDGLWAIGDVIEGPMLAHKAEEDGVAVANAIAGKTHPEHPHGYLMVPNVIYTHPEIAIVGHTETSAKRENLEIQIGKFPLAANGRALAQDAADGMVKIIACANSDKILGAAIVAPGASEIVASVIGHMEYGGSAEDLGNTIHAHPTISESLKEAALAVSKNAIHALS